MSSVNAAVVTFYGRRAKPLGFASLMLVLAFAIGSRSQADPVETKLSLVFAAGAAFAALVAVIVAVRREPQLVLDRDAFVLRSVLSTRSFAWHECHGFYAGRINGLDVICFARDGYPDDQWIVNFFSVPTAAIARELEARSRGARHGA
jgi:hypothetical protein